MTHGGSETAGVTREEGAILPLPLRGVGVETTAETKAENGGGREAGHLGSLRGLTGTGTITEPANETGEGTGTTGVTVSPVTETGVTEGETVKRDGETEVAAGPGAPEPEEVTSTRRASETEAKRKTSRRSKSSVKSKKSRQTSETPGLLYITIYCVIFVCCGVSQPGFYIRHFSSRFEQLSIN